MVTAAASRTAEAMAVTTARTTFLYGANGIVRPVSSPGSRETSQRKEIKEIIS